MLTARLDRRLATAAVFVVASAASTARAEEEHRRLTLSVNALYLLAPVYELNAEVAFHPRWSVSLRGGLGEIDFAGVEQTFLEVGAQAAYYVVGTADRGMQLGLDTRLVDAEVDSLLLGLGDGVAAGAFIGYKRAFGSGFTLGGQVGAHVVVAGESDGPVIAHLLVVVGWSLWPAGGAPVAEAAGDAPVAEAAVGAPVAEAAGGAPVAEAAGGAAVGTGGAPTSRDPLDHHSGFLIGFSIGGGAAQVEACGACDMQPSIAVDASVGWFLGRRFALMYDATGVVGLRSSGVSSAGVALQSLALQYWPHPKLWLKVGVGAARLIAASLIDEPTNIGGGGGTLAAGYEFHHDRNFAMDFQLRATHASFDQEGDETLNVDTFAGLVGFHWY